MRRLNSPGLARTLLCSTVAGLMIFTGIPAFARTNAGDDSRLYAQARGSGGSWSPNRVAPRPPSRGPNRRAPSLSRMQVIRIQMQLRHLGFFWGRADGIYGRGTRAAVARFQRASGLRPDGIAGPATIRALNRAAARRGF